MKYYKVVLAIPDQDNLDDPTAYQTMEEIVFAKDLNDAVDQAEKDFPPPIEVLSVLGEIDVPDYLAQMRRMADQYNRELTEVFDSDEPY